MKIETITIHYGLTQSLPDYCNVKPGVTLTATLDEGDDLYFAMTNLLARAKLEAQEQVDQALEQAGRPARYDPAPRYKVLRSYLPGSQSTQPVVVVVVPEKIRIPETPTGHRLSSVGWEGSSNNLRHAHALRLAEETVASHENAGPPGAILVSCTDGDLEPLHAILASLTPPPPPEGQPSAPLADDWQEQPGEEEEADPEDEWAAKNQWGVDEEEGEGS